MLNDRAVFTAKEKEFIKAIKLIAEMDFNQATREKADPYQLREGYLESLHRLLDVFYVNTWDIITKQQKKVDKERR